MTRADRWILGGLVAGMLACLPWTIHPFYDPMRDGAMYIMSAQAMILGEGYSYLGIPMIARPPGFPVMLAPLIATFGTRFLVLNAFVALWGVLCVALTFVLARRRMGPWVAAAASAAIWLNPAFQRSCSQVMSDVPGLALMMLALLLDGWSRQRGTRRAHLVLGLALAAGVYVRSINLFLLPAIVLGRWAGRGKHEPRWRLLGLALLVPLLSYAPWIARNGAAQVPVPTEQVYIHSYATAMLHSDPGDPDSELISTSEFLERTRGQVQRITASLGNRGVSEQSSLGTTLIAAVGLGAWLVVLVVRRRASEFFVGAALLILAVYFGFRPRLVMPIWILTFLCTVEVGGWALARACGPAWGARAVAALTLLIGLADFDPWSWRPAVARTHAGLVEVTDHLEQAHPDCASFAAVRGWDYGVFMDRPVLGLRMVAHRRGERAVRELIEERNICAVVVDTEGLGVGRALAGMRADFELERAFERYLVFHVVRD